MRLLSIIDPLTKAYNRRYFTQLLEQEIERAKRAGDLGHIHISKIH